MPLHWSPFSTVRANLLCSFLTQTFRWLLQMFPILPANRWWWDSRLARSTCPGRRRWTPIIRPFPTTSFTWESVKAALGPTSAPEPQIQIISSRHPTTRPSSKFKTFSRSLRTAFESPRSMEWADRDIAKSLITCWPLEKVSLVLGIHCTHIKQLYFMMMTLSEPSGQPTITSARNTSSTSIQLSWRPPHPGTIHGEFLGYRIAFKPRQEEGSEAVKEILIKDPSVEKFTIQRLAIFTEYLVSIQVYNPEGLGPSTTVVVRTDEGGEWVSSSRSNRCARLANSWDSRLRVSLQHVHIRVCVFSMCTTTFPKLAVPSRPVNATFSALTNSSVTVRWEKPTHPNGDIQGYRLYFMHKNFTDVPHGQGDVAQDGIPPPRTR